MYSKSNIKSSKSWIDIATRKPHRNHSTECHDVVNQEQRILVPDSGSWFYCWIRCESPHVPCGVT